MSLMNRCFVIFLLLIYHLLKFILFHFENYSGLASTYPEPEDKRKWLEDQLYNFNYESSMPVTWSWPKATPMKTKPMKPIKLTEKEEI